MHRCSPIPPDWAGTPQGSCPRRSVRSEARSGRRGPFPAARADANGATSRAPRTIYGIARAAAELRHRSGLVKRGAARVRGKWSCRLRREWEDRYVAVAIIASEAKQSSLQAGLGLLPATALQ